MNAVTKDSSRYVETAVEDETLLMALDSGEFFSLRETARAAWDKIDGTRDRDSLVAALAAEYGVPADSIAPDIDAFLAELSGAGLLRAD